MLVNPVEVTILAVASMAGAVIAAIVWGLFTTLFRVRRKFFTSFMVLFFGSVCGLAFFTSYFIAILAEPLANIFPEPDYFAAVREDPVFERFADDHPDLLAGHEARLVAAHLVGGLDRVRFEGERIGLEQSSALTAEYFARARENDLLSLMSDQRDVFVALATDAPELCHPFLFGVGEGGENLAQRLDEEVPLNIEAKTRQLVINAQDTIPEFDMILGERLMREAQLDVVLAWGEPGLQLMSGERVPQTTDEALTLCKTYETFFDSILGHADEDAIAALRFMFAPPPAS